MVRVTTCPRRGIGRLPQLGFALVCLCPVSLWKVRVMSASLLKKSLKLFEQEETGKSTGNKGGKVQKRSKKNKPVKSALETYLEKNPKKDKTQENLELLGRIKKEAFTQASADKVRFYFPA